ncbi:MAG: hypothetical protein O9284_09475 [Steroidobacteraceae bacterium]|nr:hypothetical protein [Steroidobacteraceae bacterium]
MQRFAEWLTTSRARALVGAAVLAFLALLLPFGSWLPGALVVLLAVHAASRVQNVAGPTEGTGAVLPGGRTGQVLDDRAAALVAAFTLAWWLLSAGAGAVPSALVTTALILPPFLIGRLLARGVPLTLTFQFTTLGALAFLCVVHLVLADPPGVWRPFLEKLAAELDRMGAMMSNVGSGRRPQDAELIEASAARMWGVVTWLLLLNTMVAAFAGLWWAGLAAKQPRLGPAFRQLKAGRTLAVVALVVTVATLAFGWNLAADATWVFLGAFVLQGLAVLHAMHHLFGLGTHWLVGTYVLLFLPFTTVFVLGGLAVFGFLDNWYPLRERLAARDRRGGPGGT